MSWLVKTFLCLSSMAFVSCVVRGPRSPLTGALREFRDKKNTSEVETKVLDLSPEDLQHLYKGGDLKETGLSSLEDRFAAKLPKARRTSVEIFIFKRPEFETYFYYSKSGEVKGARLSILILSIDGRLEMAAFTSTGDPNKTAFNHSKKQKVSGSETPVGDFSVEALCENCKSAGYDALMRHSVFFIGGKFAIHETPRKNYSQLGRKASMGCVRLNAAAATRVYEAVQQSEIISSGSKSYPNVTIHISDSGVLDKFHEDDVLRALRANFAAEAAIL